MFAEYCTVASKVKSLNFSDTEVLENKREVIGEDLRSLKEWLTYVLLSNFTYWGSCVFFSHFTYLGNCVSFSDLCVPSPRGTKPVFITQFTGYLIHLCKRYWLYSLTSICVPCRIKSSGTSLTLWVPGALIWYLKSWYVPVYPDSKD